MKRVHSFTALALTGLLGFSVLSAPIAASASEEGKRNTTYALGAAALGLLLTQKNKLPGLLAAGGAAYAYSQYNNDIQARHRWEQGGYYSDNRRNNDNRNRWNNQDNYYRQDNSYRYRQDNNRNDRNNNRDNGSWNHRGSR